MTPLSRTILQQHRIRKTKAQKSAFLTQMRQAFPELQPQDEKSRNIILGDPGHAKIIVSAHYNTGRQRFFAGYVTPKNPLTAVTMIGSKHISADNTAGVVALCELAQTLNAAQRHKIAFVFYDQKMPFSAETLAIDLDCEPTGNHLLVAANKIARQSWGEILKHSFKPTSNKSILFANMEKVHIGRRRNLDNSVTISTLHQKKHIGFYVKKGQVSENTVFDSANVKLICESIRNLLNKIS